MSKSIACTIITKSHLADARTLAETLEEQAGIQLYVLLADQRSDYFDPKQEKFVLIELDQLPDQERIQKMCFYYTAFELCCALRGFLHEYILQKTDAEQWIFLDSDIAVCASLDPIFQQLSTASILLTPHNTEPQPLDPLKPNEMNSLRTGIVNAGFLGVRRTEEAIRFIRWFKERLIYYCFSDKALNDPRGLFVDQLWLNLTLTYFPQTRLLTHPGANVGHWNLGEKSLSFDRQGNAQANGVPLLFVHFSGWDIKQPEQVSVHSPQFYGQVIPVWEVLGNAYREKLQRHDYDKTRQYPYAFNHFASGEIITLNMRRAYYDQVMQGTEETFNPFEQAAYFERHPYQLRTIDMVEKALHQTHEALHQTHEALHQTREALHQTQQQLENTHEAFRQTQQQLEQMHDRSSQLEQQLHHVENLRSQAFSEIQQLRHTIGKMEQSRFWRLKLLWQKTKGAVSKKLKI